MIVLSRLALARILPSGLKLTDRTPLQRPLRVACSLLVAVLE